MGQLIFGALKAVAGAVVTLVAAGVGLIFAGVGLLTDAAWWAIDLSYFGKKILPVPDHPSIDKGPLPVTTWVIEKTADFIKGTWDYLFGEPAQAAH